MSRSSCKSNHSTLANYGVKQCPRCFRSTSSSFDKTIHSLESGTLNSDPMQCDLCEKITDLMEANTRWKTRTTDLGNKLKTEQAEWQCKHCLAWNEP